MKEGRIRGRLKSGSVKPNARQRVFVGKLGKTLEKVRKKTS